MPILIGKAIFAGIKGLLAIKGAAGFLIKSGLLSGAAYGASALSRAIRPGQRVTGIQGVKRPILSEIVPARIIFGRAKVSGVLFYWGDRGKVARMGLALSEGACDSIEEIELDGEKVEFKRVDSQGNVSNTSNKLVPKSTSKYSGHLEVYENFKADGTQGSELDFSGFTQNEADDWTESQGITQDDTGILDEDGNVIEQWNVTGSTPDDSKIDAFPPWDHTKNRLTNISWVSVILTQNNYQESDDKKRLYERIPNIRFLVKGVKIQIPDKTTGVLGTAAWSDNAAKVRYAIETILLDTPANEIDLTALHAAISTCDADVSLDNIPADISTAYGLTNRTYTGKKYRINGLIEYGENSRGLRDQLDIAWAGQMVEHNGMFYFRPGTDRVSKYFIDADKDAINYSVSPSRPMDSRLNAINGKILQSRDHGHSEVSLRKYVDSSVQSRDGGERLGSVTYRFIDNVFDAGILQIIALKKERQTKTVDITFAPDNELNSYRLIPTDEVLLTIRDLGILTGRFTVGAFTFNPDFSLTLNLIEKITGTYTPTLLLPDLRPRDIRLTDRSLVPSVTGLVVTERVDIQPDGSALCILVISWTGRTVARTQIRIREKTTPASDWTYFISLSHRFEPPPIVALKTYQISVRHVNVWGYFGAWVSVEHVSTGDTAGPGAPTITTYFGVPKGISVQWTLPNDDDIALTEVEVVKASDSTKETHETTGNFADIFGLDAGVAYKVRVRCKDRTGNSGTWTDQVTVTSGGNTVGPIGPSGVNGVSSFGYLAQLGYVASKTDIAAEKFNLDGIATLTIRTDTHFAYLSLVPVNTHIWFETGSKSHVYKITAKSVVSHVFTLTISKLVGYPFPAFTAGTNYWCYFTYSQKGADGRPGIAWWARKNTVVAAHTDTGYTQIEAVFAGTRMEVMGIGLGIYILPLIRAGDRGIIVQSESATGTYYAEWEATGKPSQSVVEFSVTENSIAVKRYRLFHSIPVKLLDGAIFPTSAVVDKVDIGFPSASYVPGANSVGLQLELTFTKGTPAANEFRMFWNHQLGTLRYTFSFSIERHSDMDTYFEGLETGVSIWFEDDDNTTVTLRIVETNYITQTFTSGGKTYERYFYGCHLRSAGDDTDVTVGTKYLVNFTKPYSGSLPTKTKPPNQDADFSTKISFSRKFRFGTGVNATYKLNDGDDFTCSKTKSHLFIGLGTGSNKDKITINNREYNLSDYFRALQSGKARFTIKDGSNIRYRQIMAAFADGNEKPIVYVNSLPPLFLADGFGWFYFGTVFNPAVPFVIGNSYTIEIEPKAGTLTPSQYTRTVKNLADVFGAGHNVARMVAGTDKYIVIESGTGAEKTKFENLQKGSVLKFGNGYTATVLDTNGAITTSSPVVHSFVIFRVSENTKAFPSVNSVESVNVTEGTGGKSTGKSGNLIRYNINNIQSCSSSAATKFSAASPNLKIGYAANSTDSTNIKLFKPGTYLTFWANSTLYRILITSYDLWTGGCQYASHFSYQDLDTTELEDVNSGTQTFIGWRQPP